MGGEGTKAPTPAHNSKEIQCQRKKSRAKFGAVEKWEGMANLDLLTNNKISLEGLNSWTYTFQTRLSFSQAVGMGVAVKG